MRRPAAWLAATLLAATACTTPEEKLMDKRHELQALLDHVHGQFAGMTGADGDGGSEESGIIERLAASVERTHFEQYCLSVGRGERPFSLSGRLESFMRRQDAVKECRQAARLEAQIGELERKVAQRERR